MIKTTTHNEELLNNDINVSSLTTQQTNNEDISLEISDLKDIEEKVKNIRFEPSQSILDNILAYASH